MPATHQITDTHLYASITGARDAEITNINETLTKLDQQKRGSTYQLFDADKIAGWRHLYLAAANATHAIEAGYNISKKLDIETLLYASCHDQIMKAFKTVGVQPKTCNIAIIVLGADPKETESIAVKFGGDLGVLDDSVLKVDEHKYDVLRALFDVPETAIETVGSDKYEALTSLIVEKGALLGLRR